MSFKYYLRNKIWLRQEMCRRGHEKVRGARGKVKIFFCDEIFDENVIISFSPNKSISDFKQ